MVNNPHLTFQESLLAGSPGADRPIEEKNNQKNVAAFLALWTAREGFRAHQKLILAGQPDLAQGLAVGIERPAITLIESLRERHARAKQ